jgi:hypothetical protein
MRLRVPLLCALAATTTVSALAVASVTGPRAGASTVPGAQLAVAGQAAPALASAPAPAPAPAKATAATAAAATSAGFFDSADWLWQPVPASPALDAQSATWASSFGSGGKVLGTYDYAAPIYDTDASGARRAGSSQTVTVTENWGTSPFAAYNPVWIPNDAAPSPGSDSAMTIVDTERGLTFEFWQAREDSAGHWSASWGAVLSLHGRGNKNTGGTETGQQGAVGGGVSRLAGLVTRNDIAAGVINHALVMSTDMAAPSTFRYPATKTDGANNSGVATPIPEGARIQLDPSLDISGLAGYEHMIAVALQTYGAYVIDNGGARVAIIAEGQDPSGPENGTAYYSGTPVPGNPVYSGSTFWNAGMRDTGAGYQTLADIPWSHTRVLASWDGS